MRVARVWVAASFFAVGAAGVTMCGFPEVRFMDGGGADAISDNLVLGEKPMLPDSGNPCDKDNDKFLDPSCLDAGPADADCDDLEPRAFPGQDFLDDLPTAPTYGNWNCANGVEFEHATNYVCPNVFVGNCADLKGGFEDNPGCGAPGTFIKCVSNGTTGCKKGASTPNTKMRCK